MRKLFKRARILTVYRSKSPIQQGISRSILAGIFIALALVSRAWAIDVSRSSTNPAPAATSTNRALDLDQLTRDLQRFLGGARTAAIQRGAGPKASVNTVKDPATNAQLTWWVTAAENGTARQIKLKGKPASTGMAQPKSRRTETETMAMIRSFLSSQSPALKLEDPNAELTLVSSETDSLGYRHFRIPNGFKSPSLASSARSSLSKPNRSDACKAVMRAGGYSRSSARFIAPTIAAS